MAEEPIILEITNKETVVKENSFTFDNILKGICQFFGGNDIHIGVKNKKVNTDVNVNGDGFHISMKKPEQEKEKIQ